VFNMQKLFIFFNFLCVGGSPGFGAWITGSYNQRISNIQESDDNTRS
jgi:hypothetical protein